MPSARTTWWPERKNCLISFYAVHPILLNLLITRFLTMFRRFPTIFEMLSEGQTNVSEHFQKIAENDPKMFRLNVDKLWLIHHWNMANLSARDWWYQTHVKNYRNFTHSEILFFSVVKIPINIRSLYNKKFYITDFGDSFWRDHGSLRTVKIRLKEQCRGIAVSHFRDNFQMKRNLKILIVF